MPRREMETRVGDLVLTPDGWFPSFALDPAMLALSGAYRNAGDPDGKHMLARQLYEEHGDNPVVILMLLHLLPEAAREDHLLTALDGLEQAWEPALMGQVIVQWGKDPGTNPLLDAYCRLAHQQLRNGRPSNAMTTASEALALDPSDSRGVVKILQDAVQAEFGPGATCEVRGDGSWIACEAATGRSLTTSQDALQGIEEMDPRPRHTRLDPEIVPSGSHFRH